MRHNILSDNLFSVRLVDGRARVCAPRLLAEAMADRVEDLVAVRPHQRQAVHAFLAQAGALALVAAGRLDAPTTEAEWAALLRGLTPQWPDDSPWSLIVEDLAKPALLQPPVPEGRLDALKERETTPDALDMLVTSKNHDLKAARMSAAAPEHWLYALLTLQTMEGFLGAGNYGIARMNGGFASRPMAGVAPAGGWGARLKRDIEALAADHDKNASRYAYLAAGGKALLWLEPWDGRTQLQPAKLDPYFIEICRRVRFVEENGAIVARRGSSEKARIAVDKVLGGKTGDPWAPFETAKVLTVDGEGFNYRRVAKLLDRSAYTASPLQEPRREDGGKGLTLIFTATARGQGGTDGFHERRIPVPPEGAGFLGERRDELAAKARESVDEAGKVRRRVLNTALFTLFQNAPEQLNFRHAASDTKAAPFLAAFDAGVDRVFFDELFSWLEAEHEAKKDAARRHWLEALRDFARKQLAAAEQATPRSGVRRFLAVAAARAALEGSFLKTFPGMRDTARADG